MATRTPIPVDIIGNEAAKDPADPAGEKIRPGRRQALLVENRHATLARTVTVVVPGLTPYGVAAPDIPIVILAGAEVAIGPFPDDLADPTDGLVHITYSTAADLWVALVELAAPHALFPQGYGLTPYGASGYGE